MPTTFHKTINNGEGNLLDALDNSELSLTLETDDGGNFPASGPFWISIEDEIIEVTSRSGDTLTLTDRGSQDTAAASHDAGSTVELLYTAEQITELQEAINDIEDGSTILANVAYENEDASFDSVTVGVDLNVIGVIKKSGTALASTHLTDTANIAYTNAAETFDNDLNVAGAVSVGGGYGSTGATIASTGNIQTNGTLGVDGAFTGGSTGTFGDTISTVKNSQNAVEIYGHTTGANTLLRLFASRGTASSKTIVNASDILGIIAGIGWDGAAWQANGAIQFIVDGTPGANDMPGEVRILTVPDGSTALATVVRFRADKSTEFAGAIVASAIHNNGGTGATGAIASGTYTPTLTDAANAGTFSSIAGKWARVGQHVRVSITFIATITAATTLTRVTATLPVAATFADYRGVIGSGCAFIGTSAPTGQVPASVIANANILEVTFTPTTNASHTVNIVADYTI